MSWPIRNALNLIAGLNRGSGDWSVWSSVSIDLLKVTPYLVDIQYYNTERGRNNNS